MAAAETAPAVGTRRPVVRSERFVQWQRELSSARRAPYGSRRRLDNGKINGVQRESEDVNETRELRAIEEEAGKDDFCNDTSKSRVQEQQQQESSLHKEIEREISPEHKKDGSLIDPEAHPCNGQQNQLTPQVRQQRQVQAPHPPEPASLLPIKRRRRRAPSEDQVLQPARSSVAMGTSTDAIAKVVDLPSNRTSKRSTRLLTKTLQIEEPPPPLLKLPKLHVVLSRKEVQEDWLKMTGRRYTGKPKKSALLHLGLGLCTSLTCPSNIRYFTDP